MSRYRPREYETEEGPWDPISGGASALLGTLASLGMGVADFPIEIFKKVKKEQGIRRQNTLQAGSDTPLSPEPTSASDSRSQSQLDLSTDGTGSTVARPSFEETNRSSSDVPDTPLSSVSSAETRSGSLKQALRGTLGKPGSRSGSRERSGHQRSNSFDRKPGSRSSSPFGHRRQNTEEEAFDPSKITIENVTRAGKGISRIVGAGLKSPMDFTLGIARGFHNAPKLYGDDTVRPQPKVTDMQSGLKAAGKVRILRL